MFLGEKMNRTCPCLNGAPSLLEETDEPSSHSRGPRGQEEGRSSLLGGLCHADLRVERWSREGIRGRGYSTGQCRGVVKSAFMTHRWFGCTYVESQGLRQEAWEELRQTTEGLLWQKEDM